MMSGGDLWCAVAGDFVQHRDGDLSGFVFELFVKALRREEAGLRLDELGFLLDGESDFDLGLGAVMIIEDQSLKRRIVIKEIKAAAGIASDVADFGDSHARREAASDCVVGLAKAEEGGRD
jgi:hypothetical protein